MGPALVAFSAVGLWRGAGAGTRLFALWGCRWLGAERLVEHRGDEGPAVGLGIGIPLAVQACRAAQRGWPVHRLPPGTLEHPPPPPPARAGPRGQSTHRPRQGIPALGQSRALQHDKLVFHHRPQSGQWTNCCFLCTSRADVVVLPDTTLTGMAWLLAPTAMGSWCLTFSTTKAVVRRGHLDLDKALLTPIRVAFPSSLKPCAFEWVQSAHRNETAVGLGGGPRPKNSAAVRPADSAGRTAGRRCGRPKSAGRDRR